MGIVSRLTGTPCLGLEQNSASSDLKADELALASVALGGEVLNDEASWCQAGPDGLG
jgi:hypothetical protein